MKGVLLSILGVIFGVLGAILIIGSWKKWPSLVDPSIENGKWIVYSPSFIKKNSEKKGSFFVIIFFGTLYILVSLFMIGKEILK